MNRRSRQATTITITEDIPYVGRTYRLLLASADFEAFFFPSVEAFMEGRDPVALDCIIADFCFGS